MDQFYTGQCGKIQYFPLKNQEDGHSRNLVGEDYSIRGRSLEYHYQGQVALDYTTREIPLYILVTRA